MKRRAPAGALFLDPTRCCHRTRWMCGTGLPSSMAPSIHPNATGDRLSPLRICPSFPGGASRHFSGAGNGGSVPPSALCDHRALCSGSQVSSSLRGPSVDGPPRGPMPGRPCRCREKNQELRRRRSIGHSGRRCGHRSRSWVRVGCELRLMPSSWNGCGRRGCNLRRRRIRSRCCVG